MSPAIDFQSLLRQERNKSRHRQTKKKKDNNSGGGNNNNDEPLNESSSSSSMTNHQQQSSLLSPPLTPLTASSLIPPFDPCDYEVSFQNPATIYYVPNIFRPSESTHDDNDGHNNNNASSSSSLLTDWLLQLPDNSIASCDDPALCNGKWTTMKYAQRRVALFDARIQQPFPEPLASLVDFLNQSLVRELTKNVVKDETVTTTETATSKDSLCETTTHNHHKINHILINDYSTADQGILPHTDGPSYHDCTATLSLESEAVLEFTPRLAAKDIPQRQEQPEQGNEDNDSNDNDNSTRDNKNKEVRRQVWLQPGSLVVFCGDAYSHWLHSIPPQQTSIVLDPNVCINYPDKKDKNAEPKIVHRGNRRISLTFRIAK